MQTQLVTRSMDQFNAIILYSTFSIRCMQVSTRTAFMEMHTKSGDLAKVKSRCFGEKSFAGGKGRATSVW